jgi:hypothetical protein
MLYVTVRYPSTKNMPLIKNDLHNDPRTVENVKLLRYFLIKHHTNKDQDSLLCRFAEVLGKLEDLQFDYDATYYHLLKTLKENRRLNTPDLEPE